MSERRQYTEDEKAAALAALDANGGLLRLTARQLGIPWSTLKQWADGHGVPWPCAEQRTEKKRDLAELLEEAARAIALAMPGKVAEANLRDLAGAARYSVETIHLLRGLPTVIQETREKDLSPDERADQIAALLDRSRDRRGVAVPHVGGAGGDPASPDLLH